MMACPLCESFRKYEVELIRYFVRELEPDTYWIEDDFRIHNHAPLSDIGCYCDLHMAKYNEKLGASYTRKEFVKKVFAKGKCNPERKAFLDVNRETMVELADVLARAVKEESPKTDVALMSSMPFQHAIEGRDCGPRYRPCGDSPETFKEFCDRYYKPSGVLTLKKATLEYRHEIDCLLKFAYVDIGLQFGLSGLKGVEEALLYSKEKAGMLFSQDGHCVGWSFDGEMQLHPLYKDAEIVSG